MHDNRKEEVQQTIQPHTIERQKALAKTHIHGGLFKASSGGTHLTNDDIFILVELKNQSKKKLALEKAKKVHMVHYRRTSRRRHLLYLNKKGGKELGYTIGMAPNEN